MNLDVCSTVKARNLMHILKDQNGGSSKRVMLLKGCKTHGRSISPKIEHITISMICNQNVSCVQNFQLFVTTVTKD